MSPSARIAHAVGSLLARRTSRRGVIAHAALVGSAFAVAPVRYLTRPATAWAVIASQCPPGSKCADGYTAFCCEIEHGRNICPAEAFVGGWWKCTDYQGAGLCQDEGVRYYLDCNRIPGRSFAGGCRCANGDCDLRRVDCNHFRYGQCNTQVQGTTEVVCRLVICQNPATVAGLSCNATEMVDNTTCAHESDCLHGVARQLPGGPGV